eukprot:750232-Amorphochlora_amoeboformis.AAC.3
MATCRTRISLTFINPETKESEPHMATTLDDPFAAPTTRLSDPTPNLPAPINDPFAPPPGITQDDMWATESTTNADTTGASEPRELQYSLQEVKDESGRAGELSSKGQSQEETAEEGAEETRASATAQEGGEEFGQVSDKKEVSRGACSKHTNA